MSIMSGYNNYYIKFRIVIIRLNFIIIDDFYSKVIMNLITFLHGSFKKQEHFSFLTTKKK